MMNNWKQEALEMANTGEYSWRQIARELGVSKSTVSDYLRSELKGYVRPSDVEQRVEVVPQGAKILLFDLETAPELYMGFGRYKQNIQEDFVVRSSFLLSYAAKWLGDDNLVTVGLPYYKESYADDPYNDYQLCKDLHDLLSECDIAVAHNIAFDWKVANTRFVYHGLAPISPTKLVDTLLIAKANFRFPTNRLDTIARYLDVGAKLPHSGASLWRGCYDGDEDSWKTMIDYNGVDVIVLEAVYMKLRAFDKRHPNVAMYIPDNKTRCVCCGSSDLVKTDKKAYTSVSEYEVYQCNNCGKHNRGRVNLTDKEKRNSLLMNAL